MATVTLLDSDAGSSASATVTSAATITAVVGDWLLVTFAANNREASGGSHWAPGTISDSDGINTYVTRANVNYNPAGQNTGANLVFITAAVTDALTNATISLTWNSAAVGAYALQIFRIRPGAGEAISFVAADTTGSTGAATNHSATTVSVALGNMIFGAAAIETDDAITGDSDTTNGSWSALSTAVFSNATDNLAMSHAIQYKTVSSSGNQSWTCSTTSAKDSARSYLVLHLASAAYSLAASGGAYNYNGTAATMRVGQPPLTALAGSYAMTGTTPVALLHGEVIAALAGSYTLAGTANTLLHQWRLVTGSWTNLVLQSQTFDNASWTKNAGTVTADNTTAPDGTSTADKFLETAVSAPHNMVQAVTTVSGVNYTASCYFKGGLGRAEALVQFAQSGFAQGVYAAVDFTTGTVVSSGAYGTGTFVSASVVNAGGGWYRLTVTGRLTTTSGLMDVSPSVTGVGDNYAGDTSKGVYVWGAQLELGDSASVYVPTTTAAVTYIADAPGSYALTGTDASPFKTAVGGKTITAELGTYALAGTDANLLHAYLPSAAAGSYALTGATTPTLHGWRVAAGIDTGLPLLDESGNPLLDELGNPILNEGGVVGGTYSLTGSIVGLNKSAGNKIMVAEAGAYVLTGTDATPTSVILVNKTLVADAGSYSLLGTIANTLVGFKVAAVTGSYSLLGSDAALSKSTAKVIAAEAGSYALSGTDATLTTGLAPPSVSPLHIGEWPIDKRRRRRREDAAAAEQRARKRFRDAIGRLLEGLPPEFDEPADLDEALDNAVQASNLLYALSAPIREINAVNELIDHIRQLRIAQPIAQLHLAQAYNQAHRHLTAKASEDTVMALLLGE